MKLPATVEVGPHRYRISCPNHDLEGDDCSGRTQNLQLVIQVRNDRPHTAVADTLLHELLHAVAHVAGFVQSADETETLEDVISRLSSPLLDTLRRNPDLVAFLTATSEG
jgi:hypothetical protein